MEPRQQRVVDEKDELSTKLRKLGLFIAESETFPVLPEAERVRLRWRLVFMENYRMVLLDRIKAFV